MRTNAAVSLFFFPAILLAACQPLDSAADPPPETGSLSSVPRLELSAEPLRGPAPLTVRFTARLVGTLPADAAAFDCPTVAWILDGRNDGQVTIAPAENCVDGRPMLTFTLEHRYGAARAYETHVQLLAMDLPPSNTVQVLVEGPTPTSGPAVAQAGPTILLATPQPRSRPARAVTSVAGTLEAFKPEQTPRPGRPEPGRNAPPATAAALLPTTPIVPAASPSGAPILPADLYFLAGSPVALWQLPASGRSMERLSPADLGVIAYAVGATGAVAFSSQRGLHLSLPGGGSAVVDKQPAQALVWSRDGRRLAYSDGRLRLLDLVDPQPRDLGIRGRPLSWSADGRWLLARGPVDDGSVDAGPVDDGPVDGAPVDAGPSAAAGTDQVLALDMSVDPPRRLILPVPPPEAAGWLPDRPALWLAGEGLQLLSLTDPLQVSRLLAPDRRLQTVFARPDGRLLLRSAAEDPGGPSLLEIDLADAEPEARRLARVVAAGGEWAIAPGGTLAARADEAGLWLEDLVGDGEVPLLRQAASRPSWVLARR